MHTRRSSTLPRLALALPHPPLPRRPSVSATSPSPLPQTPSTGTGAPVGPFANRRSVSSPRTSSDSWNSYSENGDDDADREWSQEQTGLLTRTLEALPSHLITPFIGPVPPSNLLDNIARTIIQATVGWPHSIRATRVKLLELSKAIARENARHRVLNELDEDVYLMDEGSKENLNEHSIRSSSKRPLYRQSSMDFLPQKKESGSLSRLSNRLQRTDRIISNPGFHPYARPPSRSPSPQQHPQPPTAPITRSQTLRARALTAGGPTMASRPSMRRVASAILPPPAPVDGGRARVEKHATPCVSRPPSLASISDAAAPPLRRAGSFTAPTRSSLLKRVPSFGTTSICSSVSMRSSGLSSVGENSMPPPPSRRREVHTPGLSSDEEEKARQKKAKRARTGTLTAVDKGDKGDKPAEKGDKPAEKGDKTPRAVKPVRTTRATSKSPKATGSATPASSPMDISSPVLLPKEKDKDKMPAKRLRPKHRREPSFFGAELPALPVDSNELKVPPPAEVPEVPTQPSTPVEELRASRARPRLVVSTHNLGQSAGASGGQDADRAHRLRRVRARDFPTLATARRISFGSLAVPPDADAAPRDGHGLASAIVLH